ncbi:MAG: ABC transporter substrate-binding protein [Pseudomonadota bacterium]
MRALAAIFLLCIAPAAAQAPVVLGAVVPQTGLFADAAASYARGLRLWAEQANAAGGLLGRPVDLVLLDDGSDTQRVPALYEALIGERRAELLVGPFGSAATLGAAAVAERARRVMVNAAGTAPGIHRKGTRYVFQAIAPPAEYGRGVLEIARREGIARVLVLARDDPLARAAATRLREQALAAGLVAGPVQLYKPGADDFASQIEQARKDGIEAWIAFGLANDAAAMVKSLRKHGWAPALFLAQGAADPAFIGLVGQDAELAMGISPYEPRAPTAGNREFVQAYTKRWNAPPDALAAAGYSAARLLELAALRAGALDQEKLRQALATEEFATPLGIHRVDADGLQTGAMPLVIQIQRGRREIVWPEALATARWRLPFPAWEGRRRLE